MREDGFIGHVVFWDQPLTFRRLVYYNVTSRHAEMTGTIQPPLLAWAWSIAVGDPRLEPRIATAPRVAAREPRPRGRRPAVDRPAGRVGARLVAEVRPRLGPVAPRELRVSAARRAQPPARLGRARDPRPRLAGPLRDDDERPLVPRPAGRRRAVDHAGDRRPALGRARAGSSSTRSSPAARGRRSRPGRRSRRSPSPTCPRRSAAGSSRSTCSNPSRYWLPVPPSSVSAEEPSLRAEPRARAGSSATGAGRPG